MRNRHNRGSSLIEVVLASSMALAVLAGAGAVAKSSNDLATSTGLADGAARRVQRVTDVVTDEIRRASLASVTRTDGTAFATGTTVPGFTFRRVRGYTGALQLSGPVTIRYDRPPGATDGTVFRVDGAIQEVIAREVTEFSVARNGSNFTVRVTVRLGGNAATSRTARGTVSVQTRNP